MTRLMRAATLLISGALVSLFPTSARAQEQSAGTGAVSTADPGDSSGGGKFGLGADILFLVPVGSLSNLTGPQLGPVIRLGYRVIPRLEVTFRAGYLHGFGTTYEGLLDAPGRLVDVNVTSGVSNIPLWAGARFFFMSPHSGLYGAVEVGANVYTYRETIEPQSPQTGGPETELGPLENSNTQTRLGYNVGLGYVLSRSLPIDVRLQFSHLNLLLRSSNESAALLGLGGSVGYTFSF